MKRLELAGRRWLVWCLGWLLGPRQRAVALPEAPRILVVRLDERVGNLLLLTPLLTSLRARFPRAVLHLLANERGRSVLEGHPALDAVLGFDKRALFAAQGPLRTPFALRRGHYDLALEASNPTDPSATQAILVRLSGARHTVAPAQGPFARLASAPAAIPANEPHEIDLRLALLGPVPGDALVRTMSAPPPHEPAPTSALARFAAEHAVAPRTYAVLNLGARLANKRLAAEDYARLAQRMEARGLRVVTTSGPAERALADAVAAHAPTTLRAPDTSLRELAWLMSRARAVVSCDTGPMHLAVALGTPTLGLFVSTPPERYGHTAAPHAVIDARTTPVDAQLEALDRWLGTV